MTARIGVATKGNPDNPVEERTPELERNLALQHSGPGVQDLFPKLLAVRSGDVWWNSWKALFLNKLHVCWRENTCVSKGLSITRTKASEVGRNKAQTIGDKHSFHHDFMFLDNLRCPCTRTSGLNTRTLA